MRTNFETNKNKYEINNLIEIITKDLSNFQYKTFNLGISFPFGIEDEEKIKLKKDFHQPFIKELENKLNKERTPENSDIEITVDYNYDFIKYYIKPVYIYGIYNKYSRELPQTIYYCFKCKGRGCPHCNHKGKLADTSVQEIIQKYFIERFKAKDGKFHGGGREDVNVLMLGNGREFVIELESPQLRGLSSDELTELEDKVNKEKDIKIKELKIVKKEKVEEIKSATHFKLYEAIVETEEEITEKDLQKIKLNEIIDIKQKTPTRVKKSRVDKIRDRKADIKKVEFIDKNHFKIHIKAEAGLYIKEFISGNEERTLPNITLFLGHPCLCEQLDVIHIYR